MFLLGSLRLHKQDCTIFITRCINCLTFSDIIGLHHHIGSFSSWCYLEHLVPNPLGRLPSAIPCEHHVQKPTCRAAPKTSMNTHSGTSSYFWNNWAAHTPTPVGLWNHHNNPNVIQRKWFNMPKFCAGTNARILCWVSKKKETNNKNLLHITLISKSRRNWWKYMKIGSIHLHFHLSHRPFFTHEIFARKTGPWGAKFGMKTHEKWRRRMQRSRNFAGSLHSPPPLFVRFHPELCASGACRWCTLVLTSHHRSWPPFVPHGASKWRNHAP